MEVTVNITRWDMIRLNLWAMYRLKSNLFFMAITSAAVFASIVSSRPLLTPESWAAAVTTSLIGGMAVLLFGFFICLINVLFTSSKKSGALGEHLYTITEQGLYGKTRNAESMLKWSGVNSMHKSRDYMYVRVNSYLFHIIPKRAFGSEIMFEEFWNKANEYFKQAI
jgi:hypothetical protein